MQILLCYHAKLVSGYIKFQSIIENMYLLMFLLQVTDSSFSFIKVYVHQHISFHQSKILVIIYCHRI